LDNQDTTQFIGKVRLEFDSLPSTNTFATELLSNQKPPEGCIIVAKEQTAGRGQLSKSWESEPGKNITLSVILYPHFLPPSAHTLLNQTIALGVHDLIASFVKKNIRIKWPNDIMVGDKKIAGILVQSSLQGEQIQYCVVGIGVNINQTIFHYAERPTSAALETGLQFNLSDCISRLCKFLELRYMMLREGLRAEINAEYHNVLYRRGEWADYCRTTDGEKFKAQLQGISPEGKLLLQTATGMESFHLHEIRFL
jgi:BirA family biotin operon repressor/biotin-[acetyl-CoA-carboxylase] ligase